MTKPATKLSPKRTQPIDQRYIDAFLVKAGGPGKVQQLALTDECPVSLATVLRALAGLPIRSGQRVALEAWLDGRLTGPATASTTPATEQGDTKAA